MGEDLLTIVLSPNCPKVLLPQVHRLPSVLIAAVENPPQDTSLHVLPPPIQTVAAGTTWKQVAVGYNRTAAVKNG